MPRLAALLLVVAVHLAVALTAWQQVGFLADDTHMVGGAVLRHTGAWSFASMFVRDVPVARHVQDYAIRLLRSTHPNTTHAHPLTKKYVRFGSSPRGAQALVECGRVHAMMHGRFHLSTDDVRKVAPAVLRHRVILNFDAHADGQTPETILGEILASQPARQK